VHCSNVVRICRTDDCTDVEIVLPILDRNMQWAAMGVEICADCFNSPVAILVDDVATIAVFEQFGVVLRFGWPRLRMWSNANLGIELTGTSFVRR